MPHHGVHSFEKVWLNEVLMKDDDKTQIEKIIRNRKEAHHFFTTHADSKVYKAFQEMQSAAFSPGTLSTMHKELIAVGISVVVNCESCMEWHIHQAILAGATDRHIVEAIEVGIEIGGGAATVSARFALKALEYHQEKR